MSKTWLPPPGTTWRVRQVLLGLLLGVGGMALLAAEAAAHYPTAPVGFAAATLALIILLIVVPMRVTAESSEVFPGTPEQLFEIAADIKLGLQVTGNPDGRRLRSQTGQPGQPGSSWVTEGRLVLTTTVVSSDPPRQLVTTITGPGRFRIDVERTYTPVAGGTLIVARVRQRMALLSWLLRPVFKRAAEAKEAQANARLRDYLAAGAANTNGVGD
ncbi:MAG: SRPBCC family protein [Candidatus Dormiibacterota bacterium]